MLDFAHTALRKALAKAAKPLGVTSLTCRTGTDKKVRSAGAA
jgi:hypothetical protein